MIKLIGLSSVRIGICQETKLAFSPLPKWLPCSRYSCIELQNVILLSNHCAVAGNALDTLTKKARSALMAKVRSHGNRSTEWRLRLALVRAGIRRRQMHPRSVPGQPDSGSLRGALRYLLTVVSGTDARRCLRLPKADRLYWKVKIKGNRRRGVAIARILKNRGIRVIEFGSMPCRGHVIRAACVEGLLSELSPRLSGIIFYPAPYGPARSNNLLIHRF